MKRRTITVDSGKYTVVLHDTDKNGIYLRVREPQPVPSEPGWYYARRDGWERIEPVKITRFLGQGLFAYHSGDELVLLHQFTWFGPVPTVEERQP